MAGSPARMSNQRSDGFSRCLVLTKFVMYTYSYIGVMLCEARM